MNLPKNGRIVVIDNEPTDALPLVTILSKSGHPSSYFSGQITELPDGPIHGIRVLFFDMVLTSEEHNDPIILSTVKSMLGRILSDKNGPFIPVAWTNRSDLVADIQTYLKSRGFHFPILMWEKKNFKKNGGGGYDIQKILTELKNSLNGRESMEPFLLWENLVHHATGKTIDDFFQLKAFNDDKWNEKMKVLIWKLAKGYAGRQLDKSNSSEVIKNSLFAFNSAFLDALYSEITQDEKASVINISFDNIKNDVDIETNGKINSKFMLTEPMDQKNLPGNVYDNLDVPKVSIADLFEDTKEIKFKDVENFMNEKAKHITLEITPVCDYAQAKWKLNRLLPGLLWPAKFGENIKNGKFVYRSPIIRYFDDEIYHLVFDFRYFTSLPFTALEDKKYIFRVKQEFLTEIQSHLAGHVNRPGTVYLD